MFLFSGETFARLVDNYMRPAIHKGVPPLFNNIRNLYTEKDKVITFKVCLRTTLVCGKLKIIFYCL